MSLIIDDVAVHAARTVYYWPQGSRLGTAFFFWSASR